MEDWRLLRGQGEIAMFPISKLDANAGGHLMCIHRDKGAAKEMMNRFMEVMKNPRVRVIFAHDREWYDKKTFFPEKAPSL